MRAARRLARRGLSTASASSSHHFVRAARHGLPLAGLGGAALYLSAGGRTTRSSISTTTRVRAGVAADHGRDDDADGLRRRYRFEKQLGVGAFGEVWLAVDSASGERAIKLLSLTEARSRRRCSWRSRRSTRCAPWDATRTSPTPRVHWLQSDGDGIDGDGGDARPTWRW